MPLFSKKFSVPKLPSRKASSMTNLSQLDANVHSNEFGLDYGVVKARLSGRNLIFKDGRWRVEDDRSDSGDNHVSKEAGHLKSQNRKLYEENNLLKIKVDILLDMLAETTAEVQLQESEIESLRGMIHRKPTSTLSQPAISAPRALS
ncbi:unnamed protein product [Mesocestoides corti]|uniref:Chibby homolog 1 n=1 Tax=Mesocestoides corti TaxID=53468 RepID=A0A0R3UI17_MESCO|nr:unnamed protein product [Mesocestoides corti]